MGKINRFLLMLIAMAAIMLAAVGIDKGIQAYDAWKWRSEQLVRYEQVYADVADMQVTIRELSQDQDAIEAFIAENSRYFESETENIAAPGRFDAPDDMEEDISENPWTGVSGDWQEDVSGGWQEDVSGNWQEDISGSGQADVSGNELGDVSENMYADRDNDNKAGQSGPGTDVSGNTLLEKRKIRGSYMETQMQNKIDRQTIADGGVDFSGLSIACLGDSITEAVNLSDMEDYQQYSYPARLKEILNAESVTNLGIGGSSIGRYWDNAFVERFAEIPEDTDLIIVMGGTNDGFCLNQEELGTMEERKANTFIGDLDELMRELKENYPDATIVFATPLPNVLHDMLRKERDYLLPQSVLVQVIRQLAEEYEIPVIDLYNSNMLDTHDAAVIFNYMPDGVHCNPDGYQILAEHFAAELIRLYENEHETDGQKIDGQETDEQESGEGEPGEWETGEQEAGMQDAREKE